MQRVLAFLLVMLLAFSVACGDDDGDDDDDAADQPTATLTTGTGGAATATTATGGAATATTGGDTGGEGDAAAGEQLAASSGCTGCHTIDGSALVGPSWKGVYGHEVTLDDGSTVTADDAYIAESIRDPGAKIVEGFQNIMPTTFADWSDEQVNNIIAYIKTLE